MNSDRHHKQPPPTRQEAPWRDYGWYNEDGELVGYVTEQQWNEQYEIGFRALMLSTDLETYHALLRGESVPIDRLDPEQVTRYGLKKDADA